LLKTEIINILFCTHIVSTVKVVSPITWIGPDQTWLDWEKLHAGAYCADFEIRIGLEWSKTIQKKVEIF